MESAVCKIMLSRGYYSHIRETICHPTRRTLKKKKEVKAKSSPASFIICNYNYPAFCHLMCLICIFFYLAYLETINDINGRELCQDLPEFPIAPSTHRQPRKDSFSCINPHSIGSPWSRTPATRLISRRRTGFGGAAIHTLLGMKHRAPCTLLYRNN